MEILDEDEAAWDDKEIESGAPENIPLGIDKDLVTQENNAMLQKNNVKEEIIVASTSQKETEQNLEIEPTKDKSSILAWLQLSTSTSTEQEDFTPYKPLFDSSDKETREDEPEIVSETVNGNNLCSSSEQEIIKKDETIPSSKQRVKDTDKKTFIETENIDHDTSSFINNVEIKEGHNRLTKSDHEQNLVETTSAAVIINSNENKSTKDILTVDIDNNGIYDENELLQKPIDKAIEVVREVNEEKIQSNTVNEMDQDICHKPEKVYDLTENKMIEQVEKSKLTLNIQVNDTIFQEEIEDSTNPAIESLASDLSSEIIYSTLKRKKKEMKQETLCPKSVDVKTGESGLDQKLAEHEQKVEVGPSSSEETYKQEDMQEINKYQKFTNKSSSETNDAESVDLCAANGKNEADPIEIDVKAINNTDSNIDTGVDLVSNNTDSNTSTVLDQVNNNTDSNTDTRVDLVSTDSNTSTVLVPVSNNTDSNRDTGVNLFSNKTDSNTDTGEYSMVSDKTILKTSTVDDLLSNDTQKPDCNKLIDDLPIMSTEEQNPKKKKESTENICEMSVANACIESVESQVTETNINAVEDAKYKFFEYKSSLPTSPVIIKRKITVDILSTESKPTANGHKNIDNENEMPDLIEPSIGNTDLHFDAIDDAIGKAVKALPTKDEVHKSIEIFELIAEKIDESVSVDESKFRRFISIDESVKSNGEHNHVLPKLQGVSSRHSYIGLDNQDGEQNNVLLSSNQFSASLSVINTKSSDEKVNTSCQESISEIGLKEDSSDQKEVFSVLKADLPALKEVSPVLKKDYPVLKEVSPVLKEDYPVLKKDSPSLKEDSPVLEEDTPVLKEVSPVLKEVSPVLKEDTTVLKENSPVLKEVCSVLKEDSPVLKEDSSVLKEDSSVLKEDSPVLKEDSLVQKEDSPVQKEDFSVLKKDSSVLKEDSSVLNKDSPVLKENSSVLKEDSTVLKEDSPVLKKDSPALKEDSPVLKEDSPVLKEDSPVLKEDSPVLKEDSPDPVLLKEYSSVPTEESPVLKQETQVLNEDIKKEILFCTEDLPVTKNDCPVNLDGNMPYNEEETPIFKDSSISKEISPVLDENLKQDNLVLTRDPVPEPVQNDSTTVLKEASYVLSKSILPVNVNTPSDVLDQNAVNGELLDTSEAQECAAASRKECCGLPVLPTSPVVDTEEGSVTADNRDSAERSNSEPKSGNNTLRRRSRNNSQKKKKRRKSKLYF